MDELVKQALAKWPNVPDCTGWLALDPRGRWRIGEATAGTRQTITNATMIAFINRNYFCDDIGRWLFQNGPQRVFVELEYTPFVWRLVPRGHDQWTLAAHTGFAAEPSTIWLDESGRFVVEAKAESNRLCVGVVHDHDTALLADALCDANGKPLGDDAEAYITALLSDSADATSLTLAWPTRPGTLAATSRAHFRIERIEAGQVASRFGFDPHPAATIKVDLDSRR